MEQMLRMIRGRWPVVNLITRGVFAAVLILSPLTIYPPPPSFASGGTELREKWSKKVVAIKNGVCKDENKRKVVKKLVYAAVLIVHNELAEARQVMETAKTKAVSDECKKAIEAAKNPSAVR